MAMIEYAIGCLSVTNEAQHHLINELLIWVTVLEERWDSLILILDSLEPIPVPAPGGNLLVEIVNGTNDVVV